MISTASSAVAVLTISTTARPDGSRPLRRYSGIRSSPHYFDCQDVVAAEQVGCRQFNVRIEVGIADGPAAIRYAVAAEGDVEIG